MGASGTMDRGLRNYTRMLRNRRYCDRVHTARFRVYLRPAAQYNLQYLR